MAHLEEENIQLRDTWVTEPFLPPEWKLTYSEHRLVMVLYRKRGVVMSSKRLLTAMYGASPNVKPDIINAYACTTRKKLRQAKSIVAIESYGTGGHGGYWLGPASIHEIDQLLETSMQPVRYRRQS